MITQFDPLHDRTGEPRGGATEYGQAVWTRMPFAMLKFVQLHTGFGTEQLCQCHAVRIEQMNREMSGALGDLESVVRGGESNQESARLNTDLRRETDQTTRPPSFGPGRHDPHRRIGTRHHRVEGPKHIVGYPAHPASLSVGRIDIRWPPPL